VGAPLVAGNVATIHISRGGERMRAPAREHSPAGTPAQGQDLNIQVRHYWDKQTCGTGPQITEGAQPGSREWFERIVSHRYSIEPHIPRVAQFWRFKGARVLEIGVGAGADHLQWARAGALCHGIDLSPAAVETTRAHLSLHGFSSELRCADGESLPFADCCFDVAYSWGVIHHSERPSRVVQEIRRVLKPGGQFIGMMYNRHSLVVLKLWLRHALFKCQPWRSFSDVVWHHMESIGTKSYIRPELEELFAQFRTVRIEPVLTAYDKRWIPAPLHSLLPITAGWNLAIAATK
jgi:ubiquinone/menaquinone biosynthesis C-methylase UbiE